uniref:Uncharacterized protein n=1 Tax=Anopheles dirus TaxID=7168 RepID=A0A182MYI0_9DIPT
MKLVLLACLCLVALLATASLAAPTTARKPNDSSSESVESNESNSKETTGEVNSAVEVTEDTNTAQEVTVPENPKDTQTSDRVEPALTAARLPESTSGVAVPESTKALVVAESTVAKLPESTNVVEVNDPVTVEVTVTVASNGEDVQVRTEPDEDVPATATEAAVTAETVATDV